MAKSFRSLRIESDRSSKRTIIGRTLGIEILQQEANETSLADSTVQVPYFMAEIIEEITIQARRSKFIDQASEYRLVSRYPTTAP